VAPKYTLRKSGEEKDTQIIDSIPRTPLDRKVFNFNGDCIDPLAHTIIVEALVYCLETSAKRIESMGKIFPTVEPTGDRVLSMLASIYDEVADLKECAVPAGAPGYHYPGSPPPPVVEEEPVFTSERRRKGLPLGEVTGAGKKEEEKAPATTKAPTAEPWQMTLENYIKANPSLVRQDAQKQYLDSVMKAMTEGKKLSKRVLAQKEVVNLLKEAKVPAPAVPPAPKVPSKPVPVIIGGKKYDSMEKAAQALKIKPVQEPQGPNYLQAFAQAGYKPDWSKKDQLTLTKEAPAPLMPAGWKDKAAWESLTPAAKEVILRTMPPEKK